MQAMFAEKLFDLISYPNQYSSYASWSENGESFIVHNPVLFARDVLPPLYSHSNFSSFIRQLNLYGFKKLKRAYFKKGEISDEERAARPCEFGHRCFKRGRRDMVKQINRRPKEKLRELIQEEIEREFEEKNSQRPIEPIPAEQTPDLEEQDAIYDSIAKAAGEKSRLIPRSDSFERRT